jgi:hypothetical protein
MKGVFGRTGNTSMQQVSKGPVSRVESVAEVVQRFVCLKHHRRKCCVATFCDIVM